MTRKDTGLRGEKLAAEFLRKHGYRLRETNYRAPEGEMDIIAQKDDCLVFVEVRTKTTRDFGTPEESITRSKQQRLRAVAAHYRQGHQGLPPFWRIDVLAIELGAQGKPLRLELIENAVGGD